MVDHKNKFIFIHCHKCAGESIQKSLTGSVDRGFKNDKYEGSPQKHWNACDYRKHCGDSVWNNYFKFSFIRNPWDRIISWVSYRNKRQNRQNAQILEKDIINLLENPYVQKSSYVNMLGLNRGLSVDFIGRFERLDQDFQELSNILFKKQIELPHCNKSSRKSYQDYYTESAKELVEETFKEDIKKFNFKY